MKITVSKIISKYRSWLNGFSVRQLAYGLTFFAVFIMIFGYLIRIDIIRLAEPLTIFINDFYANFTAEILSVTLTIIVIDALNERRSVNQEKKDLILQMGSPDNGFALEAVRILRAKGWLYDGSLRFSGFRKANLKNAELALESILESPLNSRKEIAELKIPILKQVVFQNTNFEGAVFNLADLRKSMFDSCNMKKTDLLSTNLEGTFIHFCNLSNANFFKANLQGTSFVESNLEGVEFTEAVFDERTILPDKVHWSPSIDLSKYTNPAHPSFWRSSFRNSPAHKNDEQKAA